MRGVILTAGLGTRSHFATRGLPKCLTIIGDEPILIHQLRLLRAWGVSEMTIVHGPGDQGLIRRAIDQSWNSAAPCRLVQQDDATGPADALRLAVDEQGEAIVVILADTYLPHSSVVPAPDSVGTAWTEVAGDYCLVEIDDEGEVKHLVDKPHARSSGEAVIGLYRFESAPSLSAALAATPLEGELAPVLENYRSSRSLRAQRYDWDDLGSWRGMTLASRRALSGRAFHSFAVTPDGVLEKSGPPELIANEVAWFENLPPSAEAVTPRRIDTKRGGTSFSIEVLDYPTLAQMWVYDGLTAGTWRELIGDLLQACQRAFWSVRESEAVPTRAWARERYEGKTLARLNRWKPHAQLAAVPLILNGRELPPFQELWQAVAPQIDRLVRSTPDLTLTHGDMTFSNVLVSRSFGFFRFIDPSSSVSRGCMSGDRRYDLAKIRQCYAGNYDFLARDLFELDGSGSSFSLRVFGADRSAIIPILDEVLADRVELSSVRLIEALQFLSMAPLHEESPRRQFAMYLVGMSKLFDEAIGAGA